ncbi:response regulator [Streptosporangium sp. NPDC049644]|uniref:response regulator n=1 Tax=Streptosporangium sp. NPDC049644 TaxID=3155507 RepID=UPI00342A075D
MTLRCLIVDDDDRFLEVARDLLGREGISVVGVVSTSAVALRRAAELRPDVVLVDICLGDESGFDLARLLAEGALEGGSSVILVSAYAETDFADMIAASPAAGLLPRDCTNNGSVP